MNNRVPLFYENGCLAGWLDNETFRVQLVGHTEDGKKDLPIQTKDGNMSSSEDRMIGYH